MCQRPLTLVLLQKYRDTNGRRIVLQIGGVCILLSAKGRAYFCKSIAIEMGRVSRYFSKVSGSGVDLTLLISPLSITTPRGWYRAQKPLNPGNTKNYEKIQNLPPQVAPRKYEKNTEKTQERQFNCPFCIFSVTFSYFRGATWGRGFCIFFFVIFSYFRESGVFGLWTTPAGS